MGATSPRAAAGTLVAFLAMQDIYAQPIESLPNLKKDLYAALVADWWRQQMVANVATVTRGFAGQQFVRMVNSTWLPPAGSRATLTQTGIRTKTRDQCVLGPLGMWDFTEHHSTARRWDFSTVGFDLRYAGGDILHFASDASTTISENPCSLVYYYKPTTWTFPQGPSLSFTYDMRRGITNVSTSLGRSLDFSLVQYEGFRASSAGLSAGEIHTGVNTASGQSGLVDAAGDIYKFDYTAPVARSATQRPVPFGQLLHIYEPVNGTSPALEYTYDSRGLVKEARDANALQLQSRGPYSWYIAEGGRGERIDPMGGSYVVYFDQNGNAVRHIDELGREIDSTYDGRHRIVTRTYPGHDTDMFGYDDADNVTSLTRYPKQCWPTLEPCTSKLVVTAGYNTLWNKLDFIVSARGNRTDFTYYNSGSGVSLLHTVLRPAVGGVRPTYTFEYNTLGLVSREVDPAGVTTTHSYDSTGNQIETQAGTVAVGSHPALNLTTTFGYDAIGNLVHIDGPRNDVNDVSDYTFDAMRRQVFAIQADPDGSGPNPRPAAKSVYDANGRAFEKQRGVTQSATGSDFVFDSRVVSTFDPAGNVIVVKAYNGEGGIIDLAQSSYDPDNRVECTAVRMNSAAYDSLPASACVLGAVGAYGYDRITKKSYNAVGDVLQEIRGFNSPTPQTYVTNTYTNDGMLASVVDADGATHVTSYSYDGFNRLDTTTFANGTTEVLSYDENSNVASRVTRAVQTINYSYDALDRFVSKSVPATSSSAANSVWWEYDLAGRVLHGYDKESGVTVNHNIANEYDAAGRQIAVRATIRGLSSEAEKLISYQLDDAGNRVRLTWPDGYYVGYGYDALNSMVVACENTGAVQSSQTCSNSATPLSVFGFDQLARPVWQQYPGGASNDKVAYSWSSRDELLTLSHTLTNGNSVSFTDTYSPAHQILTATVSNPAYRHVLECSGNGTYASNALNQYTYVALACGGSANIGYNSNGNLNSDTSSVYAYDPENRMVTAQTVNMSAAYAYDPLGRRTKKVVTGGEFAGTTYFLSSGSDEIAEYDGSSNLRWRFVPGPGIDRPIAMVSSAGVKTFFHQDKTGSVIAMTDATGNISTTGQVKDGPYTYDVYGNCRLGGQPCKYGVPYKYTGRRFDPETGLYYYRARYYSPLIGRFLQTDPIGFKDDLNWYTYVGNDPTDKTDPSGLCCYDNMDPSKDQASRMGASVMEWGDENPREARLAGGLALGAGALVLTGGKAFPTVAGGEIALLASYAQGGSARDMDNALVKGTTVSLVGQVTGGNLAAVGATDFGVGALQDHSQTGSYNVSGNLGDAGLTMLGQKGGNKIGAGNEGASGLRAVLTPAAKKSVSTTIKNIGNWLANQIKGIQAPNPNSKQPRCYMTTAGFQCPQ